MKIYVKNMACESCIVFLKDTLEELEIPHVKVDLGEIETKQEVSDMEKVALNSRLRKVGLELLEKKQGILVEKIKAIMIDYVYNSEHKPDVNFSVLLSDKLDFSYTYLANFFSEIQATTIERYLIALKIERIKELIIFEELTFSEIAYKLHYSSAAHLSGQFKKVTGLTPSHFKQLKERKRISIQNI